MIESTINEYMGRTFLWTGVVEDRNDPLMLGRVRVRLVGIHSSYRTPSDETFEGCATEHLPWAMPLQPITSAAMNGIGSSPIGMVEGTWVVGFSRDGELYQDLIVMGTLGGIPQATPVNEGFNDPNLIYPKSEFIGEADTNRLARGVSAGTIVESKNASRDLNVLAADGGSWSEPESPFASVYPFNHVVESESGHISEVDDTENAERLHEYHRSGSFSEIHPDGSRVVKVVGDDYEIVIRDKNMHVKGNLNITIEGNANIYTKGDVVQKVDGNKSEEISGNLTQNVGGKISTNAGGGVEIDGGPSIVQKADRIDLN